MFREKSRIEKMCELSYFTRHKSAILEERRQKYPEGFVFLTRYLPDVCDYFNSLDNLEGREWFPSCMFCFRFFYSHHKLHVHYNQQHSACMTEPWFCNFAMNRALNSCSMDCLHCKRPLGGEKPCLIKERKRFHSI